MFNNIKIWLAGIAFAFPLLAAAPSAQAGYDECVQACVADGYDEDGCRNACK